MCRLDYKELVEVIDFAALSCDVQGELVFPAAALEEAVGVVNSLGPKA